MYKPFLIRFAKPCVSPGRVENNSRYFYDQELDMVRIKNVAGQPLAIESDEDPGPQTKKADIEKGEDTKDRRMWK